MRAKNPANRDKEMPCSEWPADDEVPDGVVVGVWVTTTKVVEPLTIDSTLVVTGVPSALTVPLYIPARLILLVLAFTTLRAPPPDTYIAIEWTTTIPHI